ncbi:MAG: hypothetical protein K2V38_04770 [Gemmataceae bacterium]|nr:hypothetical protein [Gemmataceae bacterium]
MNIVTRLTDVLELHGARLRALIGHSIEVARVVWYRPWDTLHAASPVVIRVAGVNLELWSIYVAEFGFTWEVLDLSRPPFYWVDRPDADSDWVEAPFLPLKRAVGRVIHRVRLMPADDLCSGVEFTFDSWSLTLYTELDELIITDEPLRFEPLWVDV